MLLVSPRRIAVAVSVVVLAAGCATRVTTTESGRTGRISVVAAENFWGSIASQLGGDRVVVTSVVRNPETDPHDYEPTPQDARAFAAAGYVIVNGVGYDPWADKLLAANPSAGRAVLNIGDSLGLKDGDNPHRWYFHGDVESVVGDITDAYEKIDPAHTAYFEGLRQSYESIGLATYHELLAGIRQKYGGTPVGATESILEGWAQATGLRLITPASFMNAISDGADPTARDKKTVDRQIDTNTVKVLVYNSQNSTPDVQELVRAAELRGIPVTTITETMTPPATTFQDWQSRELRQLGDALARSMKS